MAHKIQSQDEALLLLSEGLQNAARAPNIKKYTPHEKQFKFHSSKKKKKLYIGGNRSGKTTGGVCEDIWRATCKHPYRPDLNAIGPNRGRVIAVDFTHGVEQIIFPQFKQWLYPSAMLGGSWEQAYDKTLRELTFSNGSTIEFMSYEQDLEKFAGTSRHWVHFDEEPPKSIHIENMARLIDTDGDYWITMTPVEGMTWVYEDLYEPNEGLDEDEAEVEIIEVDMWENPFLTASAIKSFIGSIDADEREARIKGKFIQQGGRIYKNFDPTTGGIHVLKEPIEKPKQRFKDWLWIQGLDHGFNNPTAVYWIAVNNRGYCIVFREHYQRDWTIDKHARRIIEIERTIGRQPDLRVADPSIKNRNPITGTSVHEEYLKHGLAFTLGNNDVAAGLIRVRRYLNPSNVDPKNPGRPMLQFTPDCVQAIREFKHYRWKVFANKKLAYENNLQEVPQKKDDHSCDSIRYAIMSRPDLIADPQSDLAKVQDAMGDFEFVSTAPNIADPWGLTENPNWTPGSSIPKDYGGWDVDEHMGGII